MNSVLAGLTFVGGGAALADVVPVKVLGVALLVLGGVQVAWSKYTEGQVTPNAAVGAIKPDLDSPQLEAFDGAKNIPNGTPVELVRSDPAPFG
jgi:hypothetical protein